MKVASFIALSLTVVSGLLFLAPLAMAELPDHADPLPQETSRPLQESAEQTALSIQQKISACVNARLSAADVTTGASGGDYRKLNYNR